jgi:hypothetical protein
MIFPEDPPMPSTPRVPDPAPRRRRRPTILLLMAVVALVAATLGLMRAAREGRPVRRPPRTIYVPVVKGEGLSRRERAMMTELLIKSIEQSTPLKVVGSPEDADLIYEGDLHFRSVK